MGSGMSESPTYCVERAREHREAAEATPLINVRRKHSESAEMWEKMAARNAVLSRYVETPSEDGSAE